MVDCDWSSDVCSSDLNQTAGRRCARHLLAVTLRWPGAARRFSKFFLANRRARLFLFSYMVCLHLLVSCAMFWASHHEHCT